ncbi:hypothetical protein VAEKB19_3870046 [Vibrio aestuarianus]|nr:hypothetical protein VAEKB19_3870046 [Vibrio aestuarianus]
MLVIPLTLIEQIYVICLCISGGLLFINVILFAFSINHLINETANAVVLDNKM